MLGWFRSSIIELLLTFYNRSSIGKCNGKILQTVLIIPLLLCHSFKMRIKPEIRQQPLEEPQYLFSSKCFTLLNYSSTSLQTISFLVPSLPPNLTRSIIIWSVTPTTFAHFTFFYFILFSLTVLNPHHEKLL